MWGRVGASQTLAGTVGTQVGCGLAEALQVFQNSQSPGEEQQWEGAAGKCRACLNNREGLGLVGTSRVGMGTAGIMLGRESGPFSANPNGKGEAALLLGRGWRKWGVGVGKSTSSSYLQSSTSSLSSFSHWGSRAGSLRFLMDFRVSRLAFCQTGEKWQVSL